MKTSTFVVLTLLPLLALTACKRSAQPSPEFEQAQQKFSALYGRYLDDAYVKPEMAEVESLLEAVPADSLDAEAAKALQTRIREGKEAHAAAQAERAEALAEAQAPVAVPAGEEAEPEVQEPEAPAPDAGVTQPTPGMPLAEFTQRFSGCFARAPEVLVQGKGMRNTWELKDIANCRDRHPGFATQLVVEDGPRVLGIIQKSQVELVYPDAGAQAPAPSPTTTR